MAKMQRNMALNNSLTSTPLDESMLHILGGHGVNSYRPSTDEEISSLWDKFSYFAIIAGFLTALSVIFN